MHACNTDMSEMTALLTRLDDLVVRKQALEKETKEVLGQISAMLSFEPSPSLVERAPARKRPVGQNAFTLQDAVVKVLSDRDYWLPLKNVPAYVVGLKTKEIAEAIEVAQLWKPSNDGIFYGQVSQTVSRLKKAGKIRQVNDRRYVVEI